MAVFKLSEDTPQQTPIESVKPEEVQKLEGSPTNEPKETQTGQIKEIILKGPLGHAYTEALNLLLDKKSNPDRDIRQESVYQALQANILAEESNSDPNMHPQSQGFVYVYDGKKMNLGDVANLFEDAANKKEAVPEQGYVAVVIENTEELLKQPSFSKSMDTLVVSLESIKVPLFFSRNSAINGIISFLRK